MPVSTREQEVKERRKDHAHLPYSLSTRRAKTWSPSIWNALTFWRSGGPSGGEGGEPHLEDAPRRDTATTESPSTPSGPNGTAKVATQSESNGVESLESSFSSNFSEGQVSAQLFMQPPRHVHFNISSSDQQRLNPQSQMTPAPTTPVRQGQRGNYHPPLPPSSPLHRLPTPQQSPLSQVAEYCINRDHINRVEALGLNSLLQQSVYEDGRPTAAQYPASNPFLAAASGSVSSSASSSPPPIPPTFTNPNTDIAALLASSTPPSVHHVSNPASQSSPSRSSASPSRTLARNPNGPLYYQGGGSARSRYRSPSFSSSPGRKKVAFPRGFGDSPTKTNGSAPIDSPSPSDGKRRRVGEDREDSSAQASGSTPAVPNGVSKTPATPTPPNSLRFGASSGSRSLASTPARPSPLRQSVRADSSSPSTLGDSPRGRERAPGDSPSRVTASEKASEIMAGIISNATPKKDTVPDVRNPYQTNNRSPTKRIRKPATKAARPPPRPTRPTGPPQPPPVSQSKKLSAFETIQRTAPQPQAQTGSKRSHTGMLPPKAPTTQGVRSPAPGSSAGKPLVIEIDEQEDEEGQTKRPPAKKQRQEISAEKKATEKALEVEDVDMDGPVADKEKVLHPGEVVEPDASERHSQPDDKRPVFGGPFGKKGVPTARFQSVPKEPSPLRQSFQPDAPSSPPKGASPSTAFSATTTSAVETESKPAGSLFAATSASSPFAAMSTSSPFAAKTSTSPFAATSTSSSLSTKHTSPPFAATSAQSSTFAPPPPSPASTTSTSPVKPETAAPAPIPASTSTPSPATAKQKALDTPAAALPTFVFAFTSSSTVLSKTQREAALAAPAHEVPKFDFVASAVPAPPVGGFDWKAAGMKPIVKSGWTCRTCFISNDNNSSKCISCESAR